MGAVVDDAGLALYVGDCRAVLPILPTASVQCVVTSPPYWGLRDYGVEGQLGLEATPEAYLETMVGVFRAVRRVLRDDGTLWLNMGDCYASAPPGTCMGDPMRTSGLAGVRTQAVGREACRTRPTRDLGGLKEKNLVGMPWRLAFALQADDYLGNIRREADRAWLAALVDGEGCITILETASSTGSGNSYPPVLQVRMCDVECIEKAASITGYGSASPRQEPPSQGGQRPSYQWRLNGRKAADTIAEIYPFLLIKRKQAVIAWNHQRIRETYEPKRGVTMPTGTLEKQQACRDLIRRLNRREPVDVPTWMVEPPQPVGPGWYLRSDCIWSKPNPMPESVTDRPTKAHEYVFLLTKSARYFYDADAVREPASENTHSRGSGIGPKNAGTTDGLRIKHNADYASAINGHVTARNLRSVWTIPTRPTPEAHFATFPLALASRCIQAGTSEKGCCAACGAPWARQSAVDYITPSTRPGPTGIDRTRYEGEHTNGVGYRPDRVLTKTSTTTGWAPACACDAPVAPCTVLDPFAGTGTTGAVAEALGRRSVLIELSPTYTQLARARTAQRGLFARALP